MAVTQVDLAEAPVWAREDAFPPSPAGYGWADVRGRTHQCTNEEDLVRLIREDHRAAVALVWTPRHPHMIPPEELASASAAVEFIRRRRSLDDFQYYGERFRRACLILGLLAVYLFVQAYLHAPGMASGLVEKARFALRTLVSSHTIGIGLLLFLIFAFIPWYQARKAWRETKAGSENPAERNILLRFETWMELQKAPVTRIIFVLICAVGLAQLLPGDATEAGGLLRSAMHQGEWWRLFTAPFLHGNPVHFAMNAAALLYLGKRVETFARWPHVPLVFLFAALIGGDASLRFSSSPNSLGASGGLMGWLGFLLVFESLHARLVPRNARRRLLAGVALTALIGLVGYRYIDNAAHAGGLVAGMLYAAVVFPSSASARRPKNTVTDLIAGSTALVATAAAAVFTIVKIL